jgi:hypothetical protein
VAPVTHNGGGKVRWQGTVRGKLQNDTLVTCVYTSTVQQCDTDRVFACSRVRGMFSLSYDLKKFG